MEELRARFEGTYDYPEEPGKDIALTFAVSGLLETLPAFSENHRDELVAVLGDLLEILGMGAGAGRRVSRQPHEACLSGISGHFLAPNKTRVWAVNSPASSLARAILIRLVRKACRQK